MEIKLHPVTFVTQRPDCRTCKNLYLGHKCVSSEPCKEADKYEQREPLHLWSNDAHV